MLDATGIIHANIINKEILYQSYMSFVEGGALFIPSQRNVQMGEQIFVLASLPEHVQKIPLTGKVIWLSPKQNGLRPQGFAIQLSGEKGIYYKAEAEKLLKGLKAEAQSSYTM